ncbi:MAG TPA: tetratricopeptide repeat protein [Thermoanaerobaculia bacterium]|nr:tetratricopeptide repeat protein [Thermoanaerobaculia bacterium]
MKLFKILATIAIVATAVAAIDAFCYVPYRCNRLAKIGESIVAAAVAGNPAARLFLREQAAVFDRCIAHEPQSVELQLLRGTSQSIFGDYEGALATYQTALQYDQRPEIYFDMAGTLLKLQRTDEAFDSYAMAIRFNPDFLPRISNRETRLRVMSRWRRESDAERK